MEILPKVDPPEDINHYVKETLDVSGFNKAIGKTTFCPLCKKSIISKNFDRHELTKTHLKKLQLKCKS